jgi:hypothetical protein
MFVYMFVCLFVTTLCVVRSIHTELAKLYSQKVIYCLANLAALVDAGWINPGSPDGNVEIIVRNFTWARVVGWTFYYSQRAGPYPRRVFSH